MQLKKFDLLARLLRSQDPVRLAAHLVLVQGKPNVEAAKETGVSTQSVSNTVMRFREEDSAIMEVYLDAAVDAAKRFDLLARLLRSRDPVRFAARLVLVKGKPNVEAAKETGVSTQSVSNTVMRFRQEDSAIKDVYLNADAPLLIRPTDVFTCDSSQMTASPCIDVNLHEAGSIGDGLKRNANGIIQYPKSDARRLFVLLAAIETLSSPTLTSLSKFTGHNKGTINADVLKLNEQFGVRIAKTGAVFSVQSWGDVLLKSGVMQYIQSSPDDAGDTLSDEHRLFLNTLSSNLRPYYIDFFSRRVAVFVTEQNEAPEVPKYAICVVEQPDFWIDCCETAAAAEELARRLELPLRNRIDSTQSG